MRVTNSTTYRNYTTSVNDVHSKLNNSMKKVETGRAYDSAAENPLAYFEGKKIDNQYQDTLSKLTLMTDVKNRLYQQELGARSIQDLLSKAKVKAEYIRSDSNNGDMQIVETTRDDLLQKQQSMVNDLNSQYQNFYIYGGNDISTPPFTLSADGKTLTFTHKFAGDDKSTKMVMTLADKDKDGVYTYDFTGTDKNDKTMTEDETLKAMVRAMKETGYVDIGYGTISERDTLLDTFTGGLNLITGLSASSVNAMSEKQAVDEIRKRLNDSPISLAGQAAIAADDYSKGGEKGIFSESLGRIMETMTLTEHSISSVYSDLGNKYSLVETTEEKLNLMKQTLTEQYKDKLGADPYESVTEMFANQQSYNAMLKLGSNLMNSSLFDFMR